MYVCFLKVYFSDLESHRNLLDNLAQQSDSDTREKYARSHERLIELTDHIQTSATTRGQQLEQLIQQWQQFYDQFTQLKKWVARLEQQLPGFHFFNL